MSSSTASLVLASLAGARRISAGLSLHEQAERFRDEPVQTTEHLPARASKEHAKPGNLRSKIAAE
jgi:hypothetical protein